MTLPGRKGCDRCRVRWVPNRDSKLWAWVTPYIFCPMVTPLYFLSYVYVLNFNFYDVRVEKIPLLSYFLKSIICKNVQTLCI